MNNRLSMTDKLSVQLFNKRILQLLELLLQSNRKDVIVEKLGGVWWGNLGNTSQEGSPTKTAKLLEIVDIIILKMRINKLGCMILKSEASAVYWDWSKKEKKNDLLWASWWWFLKIWSSHFDASDSLINLLVSGLSPSGFYFGHHLFFIPAETTIQIVFVASC